MSFPRIHNLVKAQFMFYTPDIWSIELPHDISSSVITKKIASNRLEHNIL